MSLTTSPETRDLYAAIAAVRRSIVAIQVDSVNEATGSRYASLSHILEEIESALDAQHILLLPTPERDGDGHGVCMRTIHLPSGQWMDARCVFPLGCQPTPHQVLASQTYARRAILQTVLNLRVRDDDGHSTTHPRMRAEPTVPLAVPTSQTLADLPAPPDTPPAPPIAARTPERHLRRKRYAPESLVAEARALHVRVGARVGEDAARSVLTSRLAGCFLATAPGNLVQQYVDEARLLLEKTDGQGDAASRQPGVVPAA